ncbi:hypothetical protein NUM_43110 [Actinocatenispora comari]|uniref:Reverse transcriptase domain-containing protein n=2 Tax=Actinocatenispora comari TaxID=2807577 RepID=A0A8J4AGZ8_9ACTN|nr:hypothetical protein NUM_43110 [Actinocatenispora comari]
MPYLLDVSHLMRAARRCMRRAGAPGSDGVSWATYRNGLRGRLAELSERIRCGDWHPAPIRPVEIVSYTGKVFTAAIPTVEDRIVHRAMSTALDPILDQVLADWVSAYRPGRNRITAQRHADAHRRAGNRWAADVDVAGASTGGRVDQLVDWLAEHVTDGSFLSLFGRALSGLPSPLVPGTGLWPAVFHLRLAQVDRQLDELRIVRFADNYLALAPDADAAESAYDRIAVALRSIDLSPHPRKSAIRPPQLTNPEDLFLIDG